MALSNYKSWGFILGYSEKIRLYRNLNILPFVFLFIIVMVGVWIFSYNAVLETGDSPEILHARIGSQDLFIPTEYLKFSHTSVGSESILLQAWYPSFAIAPDNSSLRLTEKGLWWKNVRILVNTRKSQTSFNEFASKSIGSRLEAKEMAGRKYDLSHFMHPDGAGSGRHHFWLEMEGDEILSSITCRDKIRPDQNPSCTHTMFLNSQIWLRISYDQRFLPEWRFIKSNVEEMLNSFTTMESAKEFISLRLDDMRNQQS